MCRDRLAKLEAESFDLVILDIRMPGMSGLEALDRVKATHPKLPVIVITGQGTVETAIEATKRGAFDYHLKPFEPSEMLRTVEPHPGGRPVDERAGDVWRGNRDSDRRFHHRPQRGDARGLQGDRPVRRKRSKAKGATTMLSSVELNSPKTTTMAKGVWISLPGVAAA